ncbi:MAG: hypothetical protein K2K37_05830 [Muribaculaceae bacterium]|nr:hypothetical protein [Muribaculaceae bacterium]
MAFLLPYRHLMRRVEVLAAMMLAIGCAVASSNESEQPDINESGQPVINKFGQPVINKCRDMPSACVLSGQMYYATDTCQRHVPTSVADQPVRGALVFVVGGDSDFSRAITSATSVEDLPPFDHVGIIDVDSAGVSVIEASPQDGVTVTPWADFKAAAGSLMVVDMHKVVDTAAAVERARECIGRPYDWAYGCGTDSIYCSELVQIAYLDAEGKPIFKSRPMNFRDASGDIPDFWTRIFEKLGVPIPQGAPGTNPNDMARDALIILNVE